MHDMTAAHKTLPLPVYVHVKNIDNGRSAVVRVNDRGPFISGRIIDLSYAAAKKLGVKGPGTANGSDQAQQRGTNHTVDRTGGEGRAAIYPDGLFLEPGQRQ
jgi:rare lipoprotein A